MEYSELADYPIEGGRLTRWTPVADADGWRADARRLSSNHEFHVAGALARPDDCAGSWIGTAFHVAEPFDEDAFSAVLRTWIARHEAFRTTAVADGGGDAQRWTVAADAVGLAVERGADTIGGAQICAELEDYFASAVTALTWPHLAVATVLPAGPARAGEAGGFTVIFAADHAVMDAYTQVFAIAELTELYRAERQAREPMLPPCGSYVDFSAAERTVADVLDDGHPIVGRWRAYLGARGLPTFPLPVLGSADDAASPQASLSSWLLDADAVDRFVAVAKAAGGSQTAGFLAALKVAFARLGAPNGARYLMPMHTRTAPEYAAAAGWFVGVMPVDDPLGDAETFVAAVPATTAASRANRDLVPFSFARVTEILDLAMPEFVVSFVDGRFIPGADGFTDRERALRSRVRSGSEVYLWINRAPDGLNVAMRYPGNEVAAATVHAFVAEFADVLAEVADTGDASRTSRRAAVDGGLR